MLNLIGQIRIHFAVNSTFDHPSWSLTQIMIRPYFPCTTLILWHGSGVRCNCRCCWLLSPIIRET